MRSRPDELRGAPSPDRTGLRAASHAGPAIAAFTQGRNRVATPEYGLYTARSDGPASHQPRRSAARIPTPSDR